MNLEKFTSGTAYISADPILWHGKQPFRREDYKQIFGSGTIMPRV